MHFFCLERQGPHEWRILVYVSMSAVSSVVFTNGIVSGELAWLPSSAENVAVDDAAAAGEKTYPRAVALAANGVSVVSLYSAFPLALTRTK